MDIEEVGWTIKMDRAGVGENKNRKKQLRGADDNITEELRWIKMHRTPKNR